MQTPTVVDYVIKVRLVGDLRDWKDIPVCATRRRVFAEGNLTNHADIGNEEAKTLLKWYLHRANNYGMPVPQEARWNYDGATQGHYVTAIQAAEAGGM